MAAIPRSFWPVCVTTALVLSCALGGAQEDSPQKDSPMFRRDPGHTGAYPSGKPLWQVKTEGRVRASAAVANGVAYIGSLDGSVYAVEVDTGKLVWRFDTKGRGLDSGK